MARKQQETVNLSDLKLLDKNPRKHTEKQIEEMTKSVELFGQYRPLVIDEDGTILAGNGLYIALSNMGWKQAEAYRMFGLSKSDRTKLILADNRIAEMSYTDFATLEDVLGDLDDFLVPGYEEETLAGVLMSAETATTEAAQYGILDESTRQRLANNGEKLEAAAQAANQQDAPAPGPAPEPISATTPDREGAPTACPTCNRPW